MLKYFITLSIALSIAPLFAQLQLSFEMEGLNYQDLHIVQSSDDSGDLFIAGNVVDTAKNGYHTVLKRISKSGQLRWSKNYQVENSLDLRCLDLVEMGEFIYATGMLNEGNNIWMFLASFDANTGQEAISKRFFTDAGSFSIGLKVIPTQSDANNDGINDHGLLIAGVTSDCADFGRSCSDNQGFILRTDSQLNPIWSKQLGSKLLPDARFDYDFISNICETKDGFFITGGTTAPDFFGFPQQAVLAHKVDFSGNTLWDNSYFFGNARDIGVDAFYDEATDKIYTLCNYSISHCFGVTTFENSNGRMDTLQSWRAAPIDQDIDRYGFSLSPHPKDPEVLIVTGYDRIEVWFDENGDRMEAENHIILYAFDKNTGRQIGESFQFYLPYVTVPGGILDFWYNQLPMFYYPQIGFSSIEKGETYMYSIGYRTSEKSGSNPVLFKSEIGEPNDCNFATVNYEVFSIKPTKAEAEVSSFGVQTSILTINGKDADFTLSSCGLPWEPSDEEESDCNYVLYPNPTSDFLFLDQFNDVQYEVLDYTGKLILKGKSQNQSINLENIAAGLYLINLYSLDEKTCRKTLKVVKVGR